MRKNFFFREILFTPLSPWVTPITADALMGHIFWDMAHEDTSRLESFLQEMKESPILTLSDAMPEGFLFRPMLPIRTDPSAPKDKDFSKSIYIAEGRVAEYVQLAEACLAQENAFFDSGKFAGDTRKESDVFSVQTKMKNRSDRRSSRVSGEGGELFATEEISLASDSENEQSEKDTKRLRLLIKIFDEEKYTEYKVEERLERILTESGFGKKKNIGYGRFEISERRDYRDLPDDKQLPKLPASLSMLLSASLPSKGDPVDGFYALSVKYPKFGEERSVGGNPHKRPFRRILPGSMFYTDTSYSGYFGRMADGLSDTHKDVVQYGYGLTLE